MDAEFYDSLGVMKQLLRVVGYTGTQDNEPLLTLFNDEIILTLSAPALFSAKYKSFLLENLLLARFLCWRDISRDLFFREGFEVFFFHINMKKIKNQARNEIFRQMTMTLTLIQNVIYVQWTRKG